MKRARPRVQLILAAAAAALGACYTWPHLRTPGLPDTQYYADLGPDSIDVSSYPPEQRANYEVFARACSPCHTLARAVNSPTQSRLYWKFHLARMSLHSRLEHEGPLPKAEVDAVLDFLDYDAQVRKVRDRERFLQQEDELKRRFEPILQRQLKELDPSGG